MFSPRVLPLTAPPGLSILWRHYGFADVTFPPLRNLSGRLRESDQIQPADFEHVRCSREDFSLPQRAISRLERLQRHTEALR